MRRGALAIVLLVGVAALGVLGATITQGPGIQIGTWNIGHIGSVLHISAARPIPVVQSPSQGAWPVTSHQGGSWNTAHVTSVVHVSAVRDAGPGPLRCHSRAVFVTTADGIVAHGAAGQQLYICGVFLVGDGNGTDVALVEGTGAACVTNPVSILGGTTDTIGVPLGYHAISMVRSEPFASTTVAGNQLCILTSQAATRVVGTIFYGAY